MFSICLCYLPLFSRFISSSLPLLSSEHLSSGMFEETFMRASKHDNKKQ